MRVGRDGDAGFKRLDIARGGERMRQIGLETSRMPWYPSQTYRLRYIVSAGWFQPGVGEAQSLLSKRGDYATPTGRT